MAVRACVCYSSGVWTADAFEGQRITSTAGAWCKTANTYQGCGPLLCADKFIWHSVTMWEVSIHACFECESCKPWSV